VVPGELLGGWSPRLQRELERGEREALVRRKRTGGGGLGNREVPPATHEVRWQPVLDRRAAVVSGHAFLPVDGMARGAWRRASLRGTCWW